MIMAVSVWLAFAIPTSTSGYDAQMPFIQDWVEVKAAIFILGLIVGAVLITAARRVNPWEHRTRSNGRGRSVG